MTITLPTRSTRSKIAALTPSRARKSNVTETDKSSKPGVIATIIAILTEAKRQKNPLTKDEIVGVLAKQFPEREPDGMRRTVQIQLSRLPSVKNFGIKKVKEEGDYTRYLAA